MRISYLIIVVTSIVFSHHVLAKETLNIGLLVANKNQRAAYQQLAEEFEKAHPNITINFTVQDDKRYKRSINAWLKQKNGLDVLYWQAGARLKQFASLNLLEPLDSLWLEQNWLGSFPLNIQTTLRQNSYIYALPYAFYQWGFYYKKSLFEKLSLETPKSWDAFLSVCEQLKKNGISPIVIGGNGSWSVAAWFDYFNLRINGLDFHQQLMKGNIPYTDKRVIKVFDTWKELIDLEYFVSTSVNSRWQEALPYIYRNIAGMTLLGSFAERQMHKTHDNELGFFRFPQIDLTMPLYEETPIEVFVLPKNAQNKDAAKQFLAFVGQYQIQEQLNLTLGYYSPHLMATKHNSVDMSYQIEHDIDGIAQYFDRDTKEVMSIKGVQIMSEFLLKADVELATSKLEKVRLRVFPQLLLLRSQ